MPELLQKSNHEERGLSGISTWDWREKKIDEERNGTVPLGRAKPCSFQGRSFQGRIQGRERHLE
ncbi:MAG: hypothetical protein ACTSU5_00425 [Promethearchaeota archaeon]